MLTTNELQKYIMSEINDKLDEISYSNVFFEKGDDNSAEGTYILVQIQIIIFFMQKRGR